MKQLRMKPDAVPFICLLTACIDLHDLHRAKLPHEDIINNNIQLTVTLHTSLINMYCKCQELDTAFKLYEEMKQLGMKPNNVIFTCLLTACADLSDLKRGKLLHEDIMQQNISSNVVLQTALINMYARFEHCI